MGGLKKLKIKELSAYIKPGNRVFIGSNAAIPTALADAILEQAESLRDIEIVHILTLGDDRWTGPDYKDLFRINSLFLGAGARLAVEKGYADYTPCFLSEIPGLFTEGILPIDVALIQVSPPDSQGYCSFGVSVDIIPAACRSARTILAQINPRMPITYGQSFIHVDQITAFLEAEVPIPELEPAKLDKDSTRIGKYVAMLIEDGATLQMGIGKIPNAVLKALGNHKDLGIHSEMFSDGVLDLVEKGVITNRKKTFHPGKIVTTFCMGSKRLYDYVHKNPHVEFHPSDYVNSPTRIARNDRMVAINSAIEIDLTGQVVADSLGFQFYSGIGGQVDFIRGAAMSRGGIPIIALPSTAKKGSISRIVPHLTKGSGVVTSRGDVHYVVTEYGIATLRGKSVRERALELIQIAHPKHREWLLKKAQSTGLIPAHQKIDVLPVDEMEDLDVIKLKLGDGKYFLRQLHPSDENRLQEFFYSQEADIVLPNNPKPQARISRTDAYALVHSQDDRDFTLCVVSRQGPREIIQGLIYCKITKKKTEAELALMVRRSKRGLGIGQQLLQECLHTAKKRHLQTLICNVLPTQATMLHLLKKFKFQRQEELVDGEVRMELKI
ncbi:MAG: GNAT family N-acetyltransferase [Magnetococcus sp. DMHC-6]